MNGKIRALALKAPTAMIIQWDDGQVGYIEFHHLLQAHSALAPLSSNEEFSKAGLSEDGWSIEWPTGVDLGSSQLRRWAEEQDGLLLNGTQVGSPSRTTLEGELYPEWQRRFEMDKALFESSLSNAAASQKHVVDFALMALRTLSIANGGAIIAMLTFVGNFPDLIARQSPLWWGFALLALGLAFTMATMFYAYLSQGFGGNADIRQSHRMYFNTLAMSYVGGQGIYGKALETTARNVDREAEIDRNLARMLASHAVVCSVAAFCAFCAGVGTAIGAVVERLPPTM